MTQEENFLARFPKQRPELPETYRNIYVEHYRRNRDGASPASSLAMKMEAWMHRKVAADVLGTRKDFATLEIGAGNLNHLGYEPLSNSYDIVEPFKELYEDSPHRARVTKVYRDLDEIEDRHFDRIISIATFEHLCNLPSVVARSGLLLAPGGTLRVAIPSEGTLLWTLGWKLTTGVEFRLKHGLNYGVLMRHEHVNTASEIANVIGIFFKNVRRQVFGVSRLLSFYQFFECSSPDIERCRSYFLTR
jgi:hypothetical protein